MPTAPLIPKIPKIPPIRTDIQTPQQSSAINRPPAQGASNGANTASNGSGPQHRTSKEWYYYWSKVGEQVVQNTQTLANLVTYGPHAGRPDPSTMPDGALAVESDRGAIYQNELIQGVPTWRYIAGTMWGTISPDPDQRPTDLGANDSGFTFRTTDQPPREFIWSGGAWVETTAARYGTHSARLAQPVANLAAGALWVETNRGNVVYQLQGTAWYYLAGAMWGTAASPDQRPTDLGANDTGFVFYATGQQQEYLWNGTAWVLASPPPVNNSVQIAYASSALTLTTSAADLPGATLTLAKAGTYLITACMDFSGNGAGDNGAVAIGQLVAGGATQSGLALFGPLAISGSGLTSNPMPGRCTCYQQWTYAAAAGALVKLQAYKNLGTGTSNVTTQSSISALWVSP